MSAEESVEGVGLMDREIAAKNENEDREASRRGIVGCPSSLGTRTTDVFDKWSSGSLEIVMAELEKIYSKCDTFIRKFSSPGDLRLSTEREKFERVRSGNGIDNTLHPQRLLEFKGEGSGRISPKNCNKTSPNVIGSTFEQSENCEKKLDFVMGQDVVKRCKQKAWSENVSFKGQTKVTYPTSLSTLGSGDERLCLKVDALQQCVLSVIPPSHNADNDACVQHQASEENCAESDKDLLVMCDDAKKIKGYWEQIALIISSGVLASTSVIMGESPAKPFLMLTDNPTRNRVSPHEFVKEDGTENQHDENMKSNQTIQSVSVETPALSVACGEHVEVPVGTLHLTPAITKMREALSHEVQKKQDNTSNSGQEVIRNSKISVKNSLQGARSLGAKKVLPHAAKSKVLKNSDSLQIPNEKIVRKKKDKRKLLLPQLTKPKKRKRLQDTIEDESSTEGGKDELRKRELSESSGNMEVTVPYQHYVWQPDGSMFSGERENSLASVWEHIALARAVAPSAESELSQICGHEIIDWDEVMGWYCEDCGSVVQRMKLKGCLHDNRLWKDEVGQYCEDCGLAGTDIQKIFIPAENIPPSRKQRDLNTSKDNETADRKELQFNLQVQSRSDQDFYEAGLKLDPLFEKNLHSHQKDGFKFLAKNLVGEKQGVSGGCILAHAPGTGKTCLMISFIQSFLTRYSKGRVLILAPKIMLKSWQNEFALWKFDIPVDCLNECTYKANVAAAEYEMQETLEHYAEIPAHVKKSLKENRATVLQDWKGGKRVLVMSYTLFAIMIDRGMDATVAPDALTSQMCKMVLDAPDLVVLDEGHLARSKHTKILKSLRQMRTKRRVILSGTLFHNNFKELYTLLKLCRHDFMKAHPLYSQLMSKRFGRHNKPSILQQEETIFQEEIGEVLENHMKHGTGDGEINQAVEKLRLLTASFVHWYPGKILETLPGLIEYSILLNLTDVQKTVISSLPPTKANNNNFAMRNKVFSACIHPSLMMRHRPKNPYFDKCVTHETEPFVISDFDEAFQGVKIEFLIRLLHMCKQSYEKMVIFCTKLGPLNYIQDMLLRKWGWKLGQQILRLDGTMAEIDRQEVIRLFNVPQVSGIDSGSRLHLLLGSTKACKEGISLVGGSRVVILDNHDNPSVLRQAVSRAFRIGQKRTVYVYRLLTNHEEEVGLFHRSVNKERISKVLLDTFGHTKTMTPVEEFLRPIHSPWEVEDELLQKLMLRDGKRMINALHKYNASGSFHG